VSLPLSEFLPGGGIDGSTVGVGKLLDVRLLGDVSGEGRDPGEVYVMGIVVMTPRAAGLAAWLAGTE
jgi:hypothetical protein